MKKSRVLSQLLAVILMITTCLTIFTNTTYAKTTRIYMDIDKTNAKVGDVIVVAVKVENANSLAGYQVNIKYDPKVLQAVDPVSRTPYGNRTFPDNGTLIVNEDYLPTQLAANDIGDGIINFSSVYTYTDKYREKGIPETSGILGKIGFKVLKEEETSIRFEKTVRMANAADGVILYDWYLEIVSGYEVEQPSIINKKVEVSPSITPTPIKSPTPTQSPIPTLRPTQIPTTNPTSKPTTATAQPTPSPTQKPIDGYVEMDLDKTDVQIGDIITATIKVRNMRNLSAYQINIKYDPKMLKAVDPITGVEYNNITFPSGGTIIVNSKYQPIQVADNDIAKGIINISNTYLFVNQYKESGRPEETGIICKIGFKALKAGKTTIKFSETKGMPDSVSGTFMFDWDSKKLMGYNVYQPDEIRIVEKLQSPTPTPASGTVPNTTPLATSRPTVTPTKRPTPRPTQTPTVTEPVIVIPGGDGIIHNPYLRGYPDGSFKPEKKITRAEAAVIFANLLGADENTEVTGNIPTYTDLDDDHWAAWAIKYVSSKQLFSGYPDGSFKPNRNITRAEFSTVVFKLLKAAKGLNEEEITSGKFKDTEGHWARQYIEQLADLGYINGYPDGTFMPDYNIKRAESVALINRALQRGPLKGATQIFPDVPATYWAFEDIAEGAMKHTFIINNSGEEMLKEILSEQ